MNKNFNSYEEELYTILLDDDDFINVLLYTIKEFGLFGEKSKLKF